MVRISAPRTKTVLAPEVVVVTDHDSVPREGWAIYDGRLFLDGQQVGALTRVSWDRPLLAESYYEGRVHSAHAAERDYTLEYIPATFSAR